MQDVYENIEEYYSGKKRKILIVFDNMIADMINNKKLNAVSTELFIKDRKLDISIVFITQSYFKVPKEYTQDYMNNKIIRINTTHFLLCKFKIK